MLRRIQLTRCLLPLLLATVMGTASAQDGCPPPNPNVEATPKPTPVPDPKKWSAGTPLGVSLDGDGQPVVGEDGTPVLNGRMTAPQDQTKPSAQWKHIYVAPSAQIAVAVESVTDMDHWTVEDNDPCQTNPKGDEGDTVTYHWTAGQGTFQDANSASTTWTAPTTAGQYTIGCSMDDTPTAVTDPETGTRGDDGISVSCVVEVTNLTLEAAKSSICAGGIGSEVHRTLITATVKDGAGQPKVGATVNFTVNNSDNDYPASLSATSAVSDAQGEAKVTLTSSTLIGATATVHGSSDGMEGETGDISMDSPDDPTWKIDPDELIADGESTADIQATLQFSGQAVDGHSISWRILRIYDDKGKLLYDPDKGKTTQPSGYGSIAGGGEDPTGTYHGTYTVGTKAGTIVFEISDQTVFEEGDDTADAPAAMRASSPAFGSAPNGPNGGGTPPTPTKPPKVHPKNNNSKDAKPMEFVVSVYSPVGLDMGTPSGDQDARKYTVVVKVRVNRAKGKSAPNIDPLTLIRTRKMQTGGSVTEDMSGASLIRADNTNPDWSSDKPHDSSDGKQTVWTYVRPWDITTVVGNWKIDVKDQDHTTPINFKPNKRLQISELAKHWATFNIESICYSGTDGGCDNFVQHIYSHLGLTINGDPLSSTLPLDSGLGALRSFRLRNGSATAARFVHTSILVDSGQIVDDNNTNDAVGPRLRQKDFGTYLPIGLFWGGSNPKEHSFPDPQGSSGSELQALDGE